LENQVMLAETEFDEAIAVEEAQLAELDRLSNTVRGRLTELRAARERTTSRDTEAALATDAGAAWSPEQLEPHEDQWSYQEGLLRIEPSRLEDLVEQADAAGRVLGVAGESIDSEAPWRPARSLSSRLAAAAMPDVLSATLAQRLYVRSEGLPAALLDAMRRLATFSNPLFLERQRLRISTARTPRVIACFEQQGQFLVLPRGSLAPLEELLDDLGVRLELADERTDGADLDTRFTGELTDTQTEAAQEMLTHELGVLCAPPGIGKTVIAAHLIAARGRSTLVVVHSKPLLEQWIQRLTQFLDLDTKQIGIIGAGRNKPKAVWMSRPCRAWHAESTCRSCWPITGTSWSTSATTSRRSPPSRCCNPLQRVT
jgi:hypothetical protein